VVDQHLLAVDVQARVDAGFGVRDPPLVVVEGTGLRFAALGGCLP
jgi:hypothetical protein